MQVRNMRTRAIVLKRQNTGEYDQLVTCYTEEFGKVVAVAKSAMKPSSIQGMHLDIFNLVEFELINGRGFPIITGAQAENTFPNLKQNLTCLSAAYFFAETADKLFFEYQRDDGSWNFFNSLLEDFNSEPADAGVLLRKKQIEFLNLLGYAPNLNECAFCTSKVEGKLTAFSIEARGGICHNCFLGGRRGIVIRDNDIFSPSFLGMMFEGIVEKKLSSLNFIKTVLQ